MGADYTNNGGNRSEWVVTHTADELGDAATKQRDFRQSRLDWWTEKRNQLMQEARDSGLEIIESVSSQISNYTSSGNGPRITVREDIQIKLAECQKKIQSHQRAVEVYDGWVQFMVGIADRKKTFELSFNDWLFFFGKY